MQHHDLCRNLPSPSPDRFRSERDLSRTESFSSAITADDSSAPGPSAEWTDEKHSMYLDSLETTFVNQLHNSLSHGCLRKILWGPYSYRAMPTNHSLSVYQVLIICSSFLLQVLVNSREVKVELIPLEGKDTACRVYLFFLVIIQFLALQDGKIQKMNPKRNNLSLESTADSHIILENRRVQHLSSSGKRGVAECQDQEHNEVSHESLIRRDSFPESSARFTLKHSTEVSDQNFVDAGQEERPNIRGNKEVKESYS